MFRRTFDTIKALALPRGSLRILSGIVSGYREFWRMVPEIFFRARTSLFERKDIASSYDEVLTLFGISSLDEARILKKRLFRRAFLCLAIAVLSFFLLFSLFWLKSAGYVFVLGMLLLSTFFYFLTHMVIALWQVHLLDGRTRRNLGAWLLGE